jgi:competence protein ComEC
MFSRPLVPALCVTIIGILIGHTILTNINLPTFLFPLIILLCLGIIFIIPFKFSIILLMAIFMLMGINTQISRPTMSRLPQIIPTNERIIIEGTIYGPPKIQFNAASFPLHAEKIFLIKKIRRVKINLLLKIYEYKGNLKVGERIRFPAKLKEFENFNNPGNFDYRFHMKSQGFSLRAIVSDGRYVVPMGEGNLGFAGSILEKVRGPLRKFFHEKLSTTTSPIYTALILGERQDLTSHVREPFDRSGVSHIMAVSGLHLGLVTWLFFILIKWLLSLSYRVTLMTDIRKLAAGITIVPVITYALLTGLHISTQRAMVMILVFLFSFIIGREKDVWSSLSLAALIILTLNGDALFTISFQLSFVAVAGILWLAPLIFSQIAKCKKGDEFFNKWKILHSILTYTLGLIAVTTAATIMTIPLIAHHFYRFSIVALPANLTVVPIIGLWVIPLGLLSSVTLLLSSTLAGFFLSLGEFGLNLAISLVQFWSDIPWSSIWVIRPNWLEIVLLYGVFFLSLNFKLSKIYQISLLLFIIILFIDSGWWVYKVRCNCNLRVTILDAGKIDVSLIQFPGKEKMLITHNAFGQHRFNSVRMVVTPYLLHEKIHRIDHLFLSKPELHQAEELRFMIKNFHPKDVFFSPSTERVIKGVTVKTSETEEIMLGFKGWSFSFYKGQVQIENKNKETGKEWPKFFIITRAIKKQHHSFPTLNTHQTGALTITIDPKGNLSIKSFLKKNLNVDNAITGNKN